MEKKSPLHVSDATIAIAAGYVMDVAAQFPSITYIAFAGSILLNKNRIASNYSAISWEKCVGSHTRFPSRRRHRQRVGCR
jgi:hypothetical protein